MAVSVVCAVSRNAVSALDPWSWTSRKTTVWRMVMVLLGSVVRSPTRPGGGRDATKTGPPHTAVTALWALGCGAYASGPPILAGSPARRRGAASRTGDPAHHEEGTRAQDDPHPAR